MDFSFLNTPAMNASAAGSGIGGPLSAFGGAGIGSAIGGIFGNLQANNALSAASRNANAWQNRYINQGYDNAFLPSLPGQSAEAATGQIAKGAGERQAGYNNLLSQNLVPGAPQSATPGADMAKIQAFAQPQAQLGGYTDWQLNQLINQIRTKQELDKISNFAQGQASLVPFNLNAAQHAGDAAHGIGGLVDMAAMFGAFL